MLVLAISTLVTGIKKEVVEIIETGEIIEITRTGQNGVNNKSGEYLEKFVQVMYI